MTALFGTFDPRQDAGILQSGDLGNSRQAVADPDWIADMERYRNHTKMISDLAVRQTALMETLRARRSDASVARMRHSGLLPDQDAQQSALPGWARQMLAQTPLTERPAPLLLGPAEELTALDEKISDIRADMARLEANILTKDPENPSEAQHMLRFISTVLLSGNTLDPEYLGDLLEACADACA